jgi:hypothetical protein
MTDTERLLYLLRPTGFLLTRDGLEEVQRLVPQVLAEKDAEIERMREALEEIHRLPLAPETRADMPYALLATIDDIAKESLKEQIHV